MRLERTVKNRGFNYLQKNLATIVVNVKKSKEKNFDKEIKVAFCFHDFEEKLSVPRQNSCFKFGRGNHKETMKNICKNLISAYEYEYKSEIDLYYEDDFEWIKERLFKEINNIFEEIGEI